MNTNPKSDPVDAAFESCSRFGRSRPWLMALLLFLVALGVRVAGLDQLPPGNWYDEAINGLDALDTLQAIRDGGLPPLFYTTNQNPREPLFIYSTALTFWLFGVSTWSLRLTAAWIGALTVSVLWMALRRLRGESIALVAAVGMIGFRWHVHFSRTCFRTILSTLFVCVVIWMMTVALQTRRLRYWFLAGIALGGGFYTYLSFRFVPILLVSWGGFALLRLMRRRPADSGDSGIDLVWNAIRLHGRGGVLMLVVALVVFAPLGYDYLKHPFHFKGRTDEVGLFSGGRGKGIQSVVGNAVVNGAQFFIPGQGDHVAKHNIPYRAVFDPVMAFVFLMGLAVCLKQIRDDWRGRSGGDGRPAEPANSAWGFLALLWLGLMLMGSVFSFGAPNLLRTLAGAPAAIWIWAEGLVACGHWVAKRSGVRMSQRRAQGLILVLGLLWLNGVQTYEYFVEFPKEPKVWDEFNVAETAMARYLSQTDPEREVVWVGSMRYENPTFVFESMGPGDIRPLKLPDALARQEPAGGRPRDHLIVRTHYKNNSEVLAPLMERLYPRAQVEERFCFPDTDLAWATVYRIPADQLLEWNRARQEAPETMIID